MRYSEKEKIQVVKMYYELESVQKAIQKLGYPKKRNMIYKQMNEIKAKKKSVESGNVENVTLDKIKALADQALEIIPIRVEYFARIGKKYF